MQHFVRKVHLGKQVIVTENSTTKGHRGGRIVDSTGKTRIPIKERIFQRLGGPTEWRSKEEGYGLEGLGSVKGTELVAWLQGRRSPQRVKGDQRNADET